MTDELISNLELSERTRNICRYNGLLTIKQLSIYYKRYNSFLNLRNCGEKSNLELIALINNDKDSYNKSAVDWSTILIKDIYHMGCLSERSKNVCLNNDIHTFQDLLKVYERHATFLKFQNCGRKSNEELLSLIFSKKEEIKQILEEPNISESNFLNVYSNKLTKYQIEIIIKNKFETFLKDFPGSSKFRNILIKFIYHPYYNKQPKDKLFTYVNTLINNRKKIDSEISKQKSVGTSKVRSIYLFHTDLIKEIHRTFENLSEDELEYINELLIFEEEFNLKPNIEIVNSFKAKNINIINFTTFILESTYQRDKKPKRLHIFKERYIHKKPSNIESISTSLKMSKERCRQLSKIIDEDVKSTINCLQKMYPDFINYEFLDIYGAVLFQDVSLKLKHESENIFMIQQLIKSIDLTSFSAVDIFQDINYSYANNLFNKKEFVVRNSVFDKFKDYLINCFNSIITVGFVNITMSVSKSFSKEIEEFNNLKSKINVRIADDIYKIIGEKAAQKIYYKNGEIAIKNKRKYSKSKLRIVDFTRIDVESNKFSKTKLWDKHVKEVINAHLDLYYNTIEEQNIVKKINIISENIYSFFKDSLINKEFYFQKHKSIEIYKKNISNKFIVDDILSSFNDAFNFKEFMDRVNKKYFFKAKIKEVSIRSELLNHPDSINFGKKGMFIKRNQEFSEDSYNTKDLIISILKKYNHPLRIKSLEISVLEKNPFIKEEVIRAILSSHKDVFRRFIGTGYVGIHEKDYIETPIKMPIKKINTFFSKRSLETKWISLRSLHVLISGYASSVPHFQMKDYLDENNYLEINGFISTGFKNQEKNKTIVEVLGDKKLEQIVKDTYINLNINNRIYFKRKLKNLCIEIYKIEYSENEILKIINYFLKKK